MVSERSDDDNAERRVGIRQMGILEMNSKLIGAGAIALILLSTALGALAADVSRPVYKGPRPFEYYRYNWTGFYLGANGGFGAINNTNAGGFIWGGTVGYNQQIGNLVFGLEGDYDWSNIRATTTVGACAGSATGCQITNNWITTVRGRLGYAFDRYLPYVTGGLAYGNIKAAADFGSDVGNRSGYALGGGVEYAIGSHWTAKIEYLFVNLSDHNCGPLCAPPPVPLAADFKQNFIRMGINYKFDAPALLSRY